MQKELSRRLLISCVLYIMLSVARSQENKRRAVTEHQLMHDRSRSIQSLKRLIWLSSAIERLHTAETRSLSTSLFSFSHNDNEEGNDEDLSRVHEVMDSSVHQRALELLLGDIYKAEPPYGRKQPSIRH